jgi:uncharacterized glyoxalase superfamily protein PhnB
VSLDAIGIVTGDAKRSVEFYAFVGITFTQHGDHYDGTTPSGVRIMLDTVELIRGFDPTYEKPTGSGVVLCFKQDSAAAVDALYARITNAGFGGKKPPWDAFWGHRYACVLDPDGNQIDLFAPL